MIGTTTMSDLSREVSKHTESLILEQLNDFVSRGLIILEMGPMSFVQEPDYSTPVKNYRIKIVQTCRLVLKDKEYIESLEKEIKDLKENLTRVRSET